MTSGESTTVREPAAAPPVLLIARWALLSALLLLTGVQTAFPMLLGPQVGGPYLALVLILVGAVGNLLATRNQTWSSRQAGFHLLLDVAGLTCFLAIAGAAQNPFTMLYFVPIGLATLLPSRVAWLVAAAALIGFALLLLVTSMTEELSGHFLHHVVGMWLGLAVSGATITLLVHRLSSALAHQRDELALAARAALEARHLAALGGLAAGAAHELGTPLGTIQLLVDELDVMPAEERQRAIENVRRELLRCKHILHDMATPELSAQQLERRDPWSLSLLSASESTSEWNELEPSAVQIRVSEAARGALSTQPQPVITRTLNELVRNGLEACRSVGRSESVLAEIDVVAGEVVAKVTDHGPGLSQKLREAAFQAFVTTKEGGRGLGLFLARAHLTQLGGSLTYDDRPGPGACFVMKFPLSPRELA